jgi:hypothetical protein
VTFCLIAGISYFSVEVVHLWEIGWHFNNISIISSGIQLKLKSLPIENPIWVDFDRAWMKIDLSLSEIYIKKMRFQSILNMQDFEIVEFFLLKISVSIKQTRKNNIISCLATRWEAEWGNRLEFLIHFFRFSGSFSTRIYECRKFTAFSDTNE